MHSLCVRVCTLCLNHRDELERSTLYLDSRQKRQIDVSATETNSTAQYRSRIGTLHTHVRVLHAYAHECMRATVMAYIARAFFWGASIVARAKFSRPRPLQLPARVQWHSISMSRHDFTACNSRNLSRNLPVQLFISIYCSTVKRKPG